MSKSVLRGALCIAAVVGLTSFALADEVTTTTTTHTEKTGPGVTVGVLGVVGVEVGKAPVDCTTRKSTTTDDETGTTVTHKATNC